MIKCSHKKLVCLNQYDLIRKYKCSNCNEIMMCLCDKAHGERFLPHQLSQGHWYGSRERVPVTLGFQKNICPECRGEKPVTAPRAQMPGCTSKITRYYWREIYFETTRKFFDNHPELESKSDTGIEFSFKKERKLIEKKVIEKIKKEHELNPKYTYNEISQSEIIKVTNTEVLSKKAIHIKTDNKKIMIKNGMQLVTAEEFASNYFINRGYQVIKTESTPFHVLFGIYMWLLIQDSTDPNNRIASFGRPSVSDNKSKKESIINTLLPSDFGTKSYFLRRKNKIEKHINDLVDLNWLFDYWLDYSSNFRHYLWAYRDKDINLAKKIVGILKESDIKSILYYLSINYWSNYCGWPDLLVFNNNDFLFVEVKSSNDKLSEDQKNWMLGNSKHMKFTSKIFKLTKE